MGGVHMNKGRVGEDRGSKEMDGCPLTEVVKIAVEYKYVQGEMKERKGKERSGVVSKWTGVLLL
jgi:hypothetical protein